MKKLLKNTVTLVLSLCMLVSLLSPQNVSAAETKSFGQTVGEKIDLMKEYLDAYFLWNEKIDEDTLAESVYKAFISAYGDPYTFYSTGAEYAEATAEDKGDYCGIGVQVTQRGGTGDIIITRIFPKSPAAGSGLLPGDVIVKVNKEDVTGMNINNVVRKIKKPAGTTVKIGVKREGISKILTFKMKTAAVKSNNSEYKMIDTKKKVGYIKLEQFTSGIADEFRNAYKALSKKGMKSLILDLRGNPGGWVNEAEEIVDEFLPKGKKILSYVYSDKSEEAEYTVNDKEINIPTIILIDENTASSSEIITLALREHGKAKVYGTKSFGKGIVQVEVGIADGSAMQFTLSYWNSPEGNNIHGVGIEPDVIVEKSEESKSMIIVPYEKDDQLKKAVKDIKKMK